ncbi:MAG TPA: SAM-dependent methyltransferase, partial [Trebonia sp.]|nr:SAM-dependent methyltransferase [Trebonia sp.]
LARDRYPQQVAALVAAVGEHVREPAVSRDKAEVTRFFDGFRLLAPGVVQTSQWRPRDRAESDAPAALWGGLAVKEPGR